MTKKLNTNSTLKVKFNWNNNCRKHTGLYDHWRCHKGAEEHAICTFHVVAGAKGINLGQCASKCGQLRCFIFNWLLL